MSLLWTLLFRRIIHFQKLTAGHSAEEKVSVELSLCMTSLPESQGMSWKRRLKSCGNWWNPWPNNATQTQGCQHPSPTPSWGTTDIWWMLREKEQFSLRRYWLYGIQGLFRGYLKSEVRGGERLYHGHLVWAAPSVFTLRLKIQQRTDCEFVNLLLILVCSPGCLWTWCNSPALACLVQGL